MVGYYSEGTSELFNMHSYSASKSCRNSLLSVIVTESLPGATSSKLSEERWLIRENLEPVETYGYRLTRKDHVA